MYEQPRLMTWVIFLIAIWVCGLLYGRPVEHMADASAFGGLALFLNWLGTRIGRSFRARSAENKS